MFPFNLPGPQFLLFYSLVFVILVAVFTWLRQVLEDGHVPKLDFSDPYRLAYLRGGANEALQVAAVSLMDRNLLWNEMSGLRTPDSNIIDLVHRPIEKALLKHFLIKTEVTSIFTTPLLALACEAYTLELERLKLLPNVAQRFTRQCIAWGVITVLGALAFIKIRTALVTGHQNIMFLAILAILFVWAAHRLLLPHQTYLGSRTLADLRRLFQRLKQHSSRIQTGGATSEAVLLAAIFGIAALPAGFANAKLLFTRSDSKSSCGSGCGSSCGSGCGGCGG